MRPLRWGSGSPATRGFGAAPAVQIKVLAGILSPVGQFDDPVGHRADPGVRYDLHSTSGKLTLGVIAELYDSARAE